MRRALSVAFVALAAFLVSASGSFAQDPFEDFFGGLFGGQHRAAPSRSVSQPRVRRIMPHQENRPPTYWRSGETTRAVKRAAKRQEAAPDAAPDQTTPTTQHASYFVGVIGDSLAILLANGLEETFADNPDISVLRKGKESSGLVRDDFYDWPKAAREMVNGPQKVDVAVIMLGSNDRQTLRQGTQSDEPLSPHWREIYTARVDALLAAFREKKIPVVWVGLPMMKNESFSADMGKLNEIFREQVSKDGGVYVDLWEALADERGQFNAFGPDINGQIVKLRTADGVHFTDAGALSVAHFVANEIKKLYDVRRPAAPEPAQPAAPTASGPGGQTPPQAAVPTAPAATAAPVVFRSPVRPLVSNAPALPDRPAIGPAQPLNAAAPSTAAELARRAATPVNAPGSAPGSDAQALARHVFIQGGEPAPRANRADDYTWKPAAP